MEENQNFEVQGQKETSQSLREQYLEIVDKEVDNLLEDDSYYKQLETPLKPAQSIREEHRQLLKERLELKELQANIEQAQDLIFSLLPQLIPAEQSQQVEFEIKNSGVHFLNFWEKHSQENMGDRQVFMQEMFGISDQSMLHIFDLGGDLVIKQMNAEAKSIFMFLTMLSPNVSGYWNMLGYCCHQLEKYEEALIAFEMAKNLNLDDLTPFIFTADIYLTQKENQKAEEELNYIEGIIQNDAQQREKWEKQVQFLKGRIHK